MLEPWARISQRLRRYAVYLLFNGEDLSFPFS